MSSAICRDGATVSVAYGEIDSHAQQMEIFGRSCRVLETDDLRTVSVSCQCPNQLVTEKKVSMREYLQQMENGGIFTWLVSLV